MLSLVCKVSIVINDWMCKIVCSIMSGKQFHVWRDSVVWYFANSQIILFNDMMFFTFTLFDITFFFFSKKSTQPFMYAQCGSASCIFILVSCVSIKKRELQTNFTQRSNNVVDFWCKDQNFVLVSTFVCYISNAFVSRWKWMVKMFLNMDKMWVKCGWIKWY